MQINTSPNKNAPHHAHLLGVLRARIKHVEAALQRSHHELVHVDVAPVKLHAAHAIAHVVLPSHFVGAEIKQLDVAIVVPGYNAPFVVAEAVAESHRPAVPLGRASCR